MLKIYLTHQKIQKLKIIPIRMYLLTFYRKDFSNFHNGHKTRTANYDRRSVSFEEKSPPRFFFGITNNPLPGGPYRVWWESVQSIKQTLSGLFS